MSDDLVAYDLGRDCQPSGEPFRNVFSHVLPSCDKPDNCHDPVGTQAAAYFYEWHDKWSGLDLGMVLCVECCARIRMLSEQPNPNTFAPPPVRIRVLRDANTQEPAL